MSLQTPTTEEISDNIIAQLEAELNQTIPLLAKSFMRVLAKALAGVHIILYKYSGFNFLQIFVRTASDRPTEINGITLVPLTEWGRMVGAGDPIPATHAELTVAINVDVIGGTLAAGAQMVGASNGVTYLTLAAISLNSATVAGHVRAVSDQSGGGGAGAIGNLDVAAVISFANPLPNVQRDATVGPTDVLGVDVELTASYRQRILDRFQKRPQGGAYADYELWGEEVPDVANIYPYTSTNPGQVDVYVESLSLPDGIPDSTLLDAVADAIELDAAGLATRRPAGALVTTVAITRTEFDTEVTGVVVGNLAQVQADIDAAVVEYFENSEPFIDGLTPLPRTDRITNSAVTGIVDDIVSAAGGIFTSVEISIVAVPQTLYTLGTGEKAKTTAVTFV